MVRATDGVNTAEDVSDRVFTVAEKSPMVAIINAQPSSDQKSGVDTPFLGFAYDPEDGVIHNSRLIWTSDRDGLIEKGRSVNSSRLSSGPHTITLTMTDSRGQTSTSQTKTLVQRPIAK